MCLGTQEEGEIENDEERGGSQTRQSSNRTEYIVLSVRSLGNFKNLQKHYLFFSFPQGYLLFFLFNCIFPITYSPLMPPLPSNHHTVVHVHESFFLFAQSLHPLTSTPLVVVLLSIYDPALIFLVSSVCSLDSIHE